MHVALSLLFLVKVCMATGNYRPFFTALPLSLLLRSLPPPLLLPLLLPLPSPSPYHHLAHPPTHPGRPSHGRTLRGAASRQATRPRPPCQSLPGWRTRTHRPQTRRRRAASPPRGPRRRRPGAEGGPRRRRRRRRTRGRGRRAQRRRGQQRLLQLPLRSRRSSSSWRRSRVQRRVGGRAAGRVGWLRGELQRAGGREWQVHDGHLRGCLWAHSSGTAHTACITLPAGGRGLIAFWARCLRVLHGQGGLEAGRLRAGSRSFFRPSQTRACLQ